MSTRRPTVRSPVTAMRTPPGRPKHVAIVGCGFTGTTAFHQLVHGYPVEGITIFESSGAFGPGFPYRSQESPHYLLNNTNDTMCLDPSDRRAFVEWLRRHPAYAPGLDEKASMPRSVYGEFLEDVISSTALEAERRGIEVEFVGGRVSDVDEGDAVELRCDGEVYEADLAILATGRCPEVDAFDLPSIDGGAYFATHIPGEKLDAIPLDAECHVIGASLSAYDVVNALFAPGSGCAFVPDGRDRLRLVGGDNERRIVLCSRSGRLKKVQSRQPYAVEPRRLRAARFTERTPGSVTLDELLDAMVADAAAAGVRIDRARLADPYAGADATGLGHRAAAILAADIDSAATPRRATDNFIVDYLDAVQLDLWDIFAAHVLSPEQEALFRARFETAFLCYAAPCPISTAQKLLALLESGRLRIVSGLESVSVDPAGRTYRLAHACGVERGRYVINATGHVDRLATSDAQPTLIRNLVKKGALRPYRIGGTPSPGVDVDMGSFALAPGSRIHVANMLLWGPGLYVSAAITMATIVSRILAAAFADPGPIVRT